MRSARTASIEILTPEGVTFALPLAGPVSRFLAWLIDFTVIITAAGLISQMFAWLRLVSPDLFAAFGTILFFVLYVAGPMAQE